MRRPKSNFAGGKRSNQGEIIQKFDCPVHVLKINVNTLPIKKGISVIFTEEQVILIEVKENFSIMETAEKTDDGMFYIADINEKASKAKIIPGEKHISAIMKIVRQ